jgi:NADPH:quinone reductase
MRAVVVTATGGPEVLELQDVPRPEPAAGQVLVRVGASGINFVDVYQRGGSYPVPPPFTLGTEGAGEVVALGPDVSDFAVGERVAWTSFLGSHADYAAVPTRVLVRIPDGVGDEQAAAVLLQGMTAQYLTTSTYPVDKDDWVLVHAAAGGAGLLLTQLATARGGRVVGTVSTRAKAELARAAGAEKIVMYTEVDDLAAALREASDGAGFAVVYDGVGRDTFDASLAALRPRGMFALYGAASGPVPPLDLQRLNAAGSLFITRPSLAHHILTREELEWRAGEVFGALRAGTLTVRIGGSYPLEEAADAYRALEGRQTTGKLVLHVGAR